MSLIFCDSFDHYSTLTQKYDSTSAGGATTTSATNPRAGGRCFATANGNTWVKKNVAALATYIQGVAISLGSMVSESTLMVFWDSGSAQVSIAIDAAGTVKAYRGGGALGGNPAGGTLIGSSASGVATFGISYFYLEALATIDPTVGVVTVSINGVQVLNLTGQNTRATANSTTNQVSVGDHTNNGQNIRFDDYYVCNTAGSVNNTFLGDIKVACDFGTGNGTTNDFTLGGTSPAATNWQSVNEIIPDDNVTYVADATVGHIDRYTFPALVATSVFAVVVNLRAEKDDASTRSIRAAVKSGSTLGDNGVDFAMGVGYADFQGIFETDPNTSSAWTVANVNAAEFGVKVTA